jgi:hypothetical protein
MKKYLDLAKITCPHLTRLLGSMLWFDPYGFDFLWFKSVLKHIIAQT